MTEYYEEMGIDIPRHNETQVEKDIGALAKKVVELQAKITESDRYADSLGEEVIDLKEQVKKLKEQVVPE